MGSGCRDLLLLVENGSWIGLPCVTFTQEEDDFLGLGSFLSVHLRRIWFCACALLNMEHVFKCRLRLTLNHFNGESLMLYGSKIHKFVRIFRPNYT